MLFCVIYVEQGTQLAGTALKLVCNAVTRFISISNDVLCCRPEPTPNWRTPRPLTPPPTPVQQGHPLSAFPTAVELDSTVADTSSAADTVAERPDQALNVDVHSQHENELLGYRHFPSCLYSYSMHKASETS